ncbi:MAG: hypothetical protein KA138_06185, partial [Saprospiraceae bacterium]|nr:hypothetical protein [Saprospiraceae bacterium]
MKTSFFVGLFLLATLPLSGQNNAENYQIKVKKSSVAIHLDGALDEAAWQTGEEKAEAFKLCFPNDTAYSPWTTEARLTFDDRNLYVGAI